VLNDPISEDFRFPYPVSILAPKGGVEYAEIGKKHAALGSIKNGAKYAPVFTKCDFAERYVRESGQSGEVSVGSIPDAESLAVFLKNLQKQNCDLLVVDHIWGASPNVRFLLLKIEDVLKEIEYEE
jgi:hypothetical protein